MADLHIPFLLHYMEPCQRFYREENGRRIPQVEDLGGLINFAYGEELRLEMYEPDPPNEYWDGVLEAQEELADA